MSDLLAWWVVIQVIGAVAFPIGFVLFNRLPDRGYAFSKVLGLLFVGYLLWMGAVIGVFPNGRGSVLLILMGLAVVSLFIVGRRREEFAGFLREHGRYLVFVEALFLAAFLAAAWLRSFVPDLIGTEKPYEFAYLNSILRSEQLPPNDPWLSGFYLSYYYFGFVMIAAVIKLTAVPASIGFNLGLALVAALTVVATFGVMYNLVAAQGRLRLAVVFGLVGVIVLFLGNLEGLLELMAAHRIGPDSLYSWVGIDGLNLKDAGGTKEWYPDKFFWWWRSTRVPTNWDIKEYPFFSFLLGDLHPHVMVMPFTMLATATGFNLLRAGETLDHRWALRNPALFLIVAGILGALSFLNAWSLPPTLALLSLAVFACNWRRSKRKLGRAARATATFIVPLVVIAVLLYLPFYTTSGGALWSLAPGEAAARPAHLPLAHMVTLPKHLFISWGPLFWLVFGLAVAAVSWRWLSQLGWKAGWALLPALLPVAVWALLAAGDLGVTGFMDELELRGSNLLTLGILAGLLTLVSLGFVRALTRPDPDRGEDSLLFVLGAVGVSVLLILGTELFYQLDHLNGSRENTVFKLWHHAWLFLALGGAFAVYYVLTPQEGEAKQPRVSEAPPKPAGAVRALPRVSWAGVATVLVLAAAVFPVAATFARTNGFSLPRSLDALTFFRSFNPQEMEAVNWLNENIEGTPVILEAVGDPFTEGGRISSKTGLPTVLEWPTHQVGNRGGPEPLGQRRQEIETVYKTQSIDEARAILDKYEVKYVIVGAFEKQQYGEDGLAKFAQFMQPAFQNEAITVYRLPQTILVAQPSATP